LNINFETSWANIIKAEKEKEITIHLPPDIFLKNN
jgi:hypothetical protein